MGIFQLLAELPTVEDISPVWSVEDIQPSYSPYLKGDTVGL